MLRVLLFLPLLPVTRSQYYATLPLLRNALYNCVGDCSDDQQTAEGACAAADGQNWNAGTGADCNNLNQWQFGNLNTMQSLFYNAAQFNVDVSGWNTAKVKFMHSMFENAGQFNADVSGWNTAKVKSMHSMFKNAAQFNADLSEWNTMKVTSMASMFENAAQFNADLSKWNTAKVQDFQQMFQGAVQFQADVSSWNVVANTADAGAWDNMLDAAYSVPICGWKQQAADASNTLFVHLLENQDLPVAICNVETES